MNALGYSGVCVGNQEFGYGIERLGHLIDQSYFSFISSNIKAEGIQFEGYKIVEYNGVKVGVFSVSEFEGRITEPHIEEPAILSAKTTVSILKESGCSIIICLARLDVDKALALLENVKEINYIFAGGNSAVASYNTIDNRGLYIARPDSYLNLRVEIGILDMDGVPCVRTEIVRYPVEINLNMNQQSVSLVNRLTQVRRIISDVNLRYNSEKSEEIGTTDGKIRIVDLVLKVIREKYNVEAAFINTGAIENQILSEVITEDNLFELLKYDSEIITLQISGSRLKSVIRAGIARESLGEKTIFYSGVRPDMTINGRDIVDSEIYLIAVNDFLLKGGDGFTQFIEARRLDFVFPVYLLRDEVTKYIQREDRINSADIIAINPALYWKYMVDLGFRYDGSVGYNYEFYPSNKKFSGFVPQHSLKISANLYSEWKNSYHLLSIRLKVFYELLWKIDPIDGGVVFDYNNDKLSMSISYEYFFRYCSPYVRFAIENLKFYFVDDITHGDTKLFLKLMPESGVRHHLPFGFFIGESVVFDIFPLNVDQPGNIGGKIQAFLPIDYRGIVVFNTYLNFYFLAVLSQQKDSRFNFAFEILSVLKLKIFEYLWTDFDFVFYIDTLQQKPSFAINIGLGLNFIEGSIK